MRRGCSVCLLQWNDLYELRKNQEGLHFYIYGNTKPRTKILAMALSVLTRGMHCYQGTHRTTTIHLMVTRHFPDRRLLDRQWAKSGSWQSGERRSYNRFMDIIHPSLLVHYSLAIVTILKKQTGSSIDR